MEKKTDKSSKRQTPPLETHETKRQESEREAWEKVRQVEQKSKQARDRLERRVKELEKERAAADAAADKAVNDRKSAELTAANAVAQKEEALLAKDSAERQTAIADMNSNELRRQREKAVEEAESLNGLRKKAEAERDEALATIYSQSDLNDLKRMFEEQEEKIKGLMDNKPKRARIDLLDDPLKDIDFDDIFYPSEDEDKNKLKNSDLDETDEADKSGNDEQRTVPEPGTELEILDNEEDDVTNKYADPLEAALAEADASTEEEKKILEDEVNRLIGEDKRRGDDIRGILAKSLDSMLAEPIEKDVLKKLSDSYLPPKDMKNLGVPRANKEMWLKLYHGPKKVDAFLTKFQRLTVKSMIPILKLLRRLKTSKDKTSRKLVADAFRLTATMFQAYNKEQRTRIVDRFGKTYKLLLENTKPDGEHLFGGKLAEALKECQVAKNVGKGLGSHDSRKGGYRHKGRGRNSHHHHSPKNDFLGEKSSRGRGAQNKGYPKRGRGGRGRGQKKD